MKKDSHKKEQFACPQTGAAALVVGQALMEALVPAASLNLWANRCICWSIALACAAGWAGKNSEIRNSE